MSDTRVAPEATSVSAGVFGGVAFAAVLMIMIGIFQVLQGLAAIIDDEFFVVVDEYAYELDVTAWGWVHLILGVIVLAAGVGLFARKPAAGAVAVVLAVLSAVANFFFIPYYPLWSLLMIGLAIWVIWSVTRPAVYD